MEDFCKFHKIYSEEQTKRIASEFQRLQEQHYLEHAGATLYSERQLEDIFRQLSSNVYANPHARNLSSKSTEDAIDIIRFQILSHFNTTPEDYALIFTSGASASLKTISETFTKSPKSQFMYLQDNHTSVLGMRQNFTTSQCITPEEALQVITLKTTPQTSSSRSLFAYPAQSNFSGRKFPLEWIKKIQNGAFNHLVDSPQRWYVVLDAASYVSTNPLDLTKYKPDFVVLSFYKMFGYPSGLGALLVKRSSEEALEKRYFGGGTVLMAQTMDERMVFRKEIHERFEDGTLPFLSILSLSQGFNTLKRLNLNFDLISKHTFELSKYVYTNLNYLHHSNGTKVVVLYHDNHFEKRNIQGGIINFNLIRDNGDFIGYSEVLHFANLYGIHLRTGCFCNPGACQYFLKLTKEDVQRNFEAGHVCGDQHDLVDGYPTGSIRVSFGYMSTRSNADKLLQMIEECFVTKPIQRKIPNQSNNERKAINFNPIVVGASTNHIEVGILENVFLYPVKSCGAFSVLNKWPLTATGLKYDRQWMIVNSNGVCVTQKHNKKLCLLTPIINLEEKLLTLSYPGEKSINLEIDIETASKKCASLCQSKVCGDKIQGWDCGEEVANWLEDILECPGLRLLKQSSEMERTTRKSDQLQLSLANKAQFLLINKASVNWIRTKIPQAHLNEPLFSTLLRFRPNFVVNFSKAFVENDFSDYHFNHIKFHSGGKCTRCQMICIDQTTGNTSKEPLQTLSREFQGKINFGVYLNRPESDDDAFLHIGSKVKGLQNLN